MICIQFNFFVGIEGFVKHGLASLYICRGSSFFCS